jgi:hypothetical protein
VTLAGGVSETKEPVNEMGAQLYEAAPLAVSVVLLPKQTVEGLAVAVILGNGLTTTVIRVELLQAPLAPFKVYVVVSVGLTETVAPFKPPGFQV